MSESPLPQRLRAPASPFPHTRFRGLRTADAVNDLVRRKVQGKAMIVI